MKQATDPPSTAVIVYAYLLLLETLLFTNPSAPQIHFSLREKLTLTLTGQGGAEAAMSRDDCRARDA